LEVAAEVEVSQWLGRLGAGLVELHHLNQVCTDAHAERGVFLLWDKGSRLLQLPHERAIAKAFIDF